MVGARGRRMVGDVVMRRQSTVWCETIPEVERPHEGVDSERILALLQPISIMREPISATIVTMPYRSREEFLATRVKEFEAEVYTLRQIIDREGAI
jgi:hypothetical protein